MLYLGRHLSILSNSHYSHLDFVFTARLFSSDSAELHPDTSAGNLRHLLDWKVDLRSVRSFVQNAKNPKSFEIGDARLVLDPLLV